jgi:tetratricopeptide (TPR) repeat protein
MSTEANAVVYPAGTGGERPASEHLSALGVSDEWERRADWLENEARAQRDPAARARLMLAASEVRALLGERADARRLAIQAAHHQPAPPFAARQARALHQTHGDVSAVTRSLADEARSETSPPLLAHNHYVAAEIQRLIQRDPAGARSNFEAAQRADARDLRPVLSGLVLELSQHQGAPTVRVPAEAGCAELARAVEVIARLRGADIALDSDGPLEALSLVDVQQALARGRLDEASESLAPLDARPGLQPALRWLRALWGAAATGRREEALVRYRQLARELPGHDTRRALAARALDAGSWDDLRQVFDEPGASEVPEAAPELDAGARSSTPPRPTFSNIERAVLTAMVGQRPAPELATDALDVPAVASIASAVERASTRPPSGAARAATGDVEAEFALGRAVSSLARLSDIWVDPAATTPWALVLRIEQRREQRDGAGLCRDLPLLIEQPAGAAEYSFIAGALAEKTGDLAAAREAFQAALPSPITREAATRALTAASGDNAALFRALSAHTQDPLRRAVLSSEALMRLDPAASEFDALAEDAARAHPDLPLGLALGEAAARSRGDKSRVARWLARWRENARGTQELALASTREALYLLESEPNVGRERLEQLMARPDAGLCFVLGAERLTSVPARARADVRRRMAGALSERGRQHFLAEAVALYEAAGDSSAAVDAARELGGPLGELWVARLSTTDPELDRLAAEWILLAQRTSDRELASELYAALARLEEQRGRSEQAADWQRERLVLDPGSLESLRSLEIEHMSAGREQDLEQTASALFEALGERDGLGYAYVSTRLRIARGAFNEARPFVRRVHATQVPPLWALRLDHVFARDDEDDRMLLDTCRSLRERSTQALDAATLSLHAAEAALRLGDAGMAKDDIQRASELAPDDIVILSTRAEVLLRTGDPAEAAEAFETLASATSSRARQVDALYRAATLWLDELQHRARGMLALQEAAALDVPHAGVLERLVALHEQSDDLDGLGDLIERQRRLIAQPTADASVELTRALDALDGGRPADARAILDALLEQRPQDGAVLHASADLYARSQEWELAERDFQRVVELRGTGRLHMAALLGLADLYAGPLERSELLPGIYAEILSRDPDNNSIRRRLVVALANRRDWAQAAVHQRELLGKAPDEDTRKSALLYLVKLLDACSDRATEAEALLEQARATWPEDPRVLEIEAAHYAALGQPGTTRIILERSVASARAAIEAGRVEGALFRTLEIASRLADDPEAARVASATAAAITAGDRPELSGAGARALDPMFDDLLAPALLGADLRTLLYAAASAIERAYAIEPRSLDATLAPDAVATLVRHTAEQAGFEGVRVFVSPELGGECQCLSGDVLNIVLGRALAEKAPVSWSFPLLRALKIAQVNACALTRLVPADQPAVLAGFFACFAPAWPAAGAEAQRLVAARNRIRPHLTFLPEPDLATRIGELTNELLPRASGLGDSLRRWASRAALLAVGDPSTALESSWVARHPSSPLPPDEEGRMRFIATHSEARDLVSFGVSDAYIAARRRAGLAAASP